MRLQAELGGAAAVGLHRRHPRGSGVRRLGGLRPPRLGRRTRRRCCATAPPARAWCSCGWSPRRARSRPTRSTCVPEGEVPPGYLHVLDATGARDEPVDAGARGLRAAAPDGRLRHRHQQHRPQGRPRAADARTGTATASTTASASTPRTSCAPCCGAGPASACRRRSAPGSRASSTGWHGDLRERLEDLLTVREVDAIERRCERLLRKGRFPVPAGGWPSIPWPPF